MGKPIGFYTMQTKDQEILYRLFRDHEDVIGVSQTSLLTLESIISSIRQLKCSQSMIRGQILKLIETIEESKPRIVPLINMISLCEKAIRSLNIIETANVEEVKQVVISTIENQIEHLNRNIQRVVEFGLECIDDGDFILVYSVSAPVKRIIPEAKRRGKRFKVLILRQDLRKTKQVMRILDKEDVAYIVVPEYGLSHFIDKVNKLFIGAISITADNKVVAAAGTSNILSIAHIHQLPVYLFVNSLKLSVKKSTDQNVHQKAERRHFEDLDYTFITHSHDIVDLGLIDHLIFEDGEIDLKDISRYRSKV